MASETTAGPVADAGKMKNTSETAKTEINRRKIKKSAIDSYVMMSYTVRAVVLNEINGKIAAKD
jgi:hypothetical protein